MINTGITRKLDELGRIVIPKELRTEWSLFPGAKFMIFVENSDIILRPTYNNCILCGGKKELKEVGEKYICSNCISKISE